MISDREISPLENQAASELFPLEILKEKTAFWTLDLKGFTWVLEKYWLGQRVCLGFGGVVVKNLAADVGNIRDAGFIPGLRR